MRDLPVLLLTGESAQGGGRPGPPCSSAALDCLVKPVPLDRLLAAVRVAHGGRRAAPDLRLAAQRAGRASRASVGGGRGVPGGPGLTGSAGTVRYTGTRRSATAAHATSSAPGRLPTGLPSRRRSSRRSL